MKVCDCPVCWYAYIDEKRNELVEMVVLKSHIKTEEDLEQLFFDDCELNLFCPRCGSDLKSFYCSIKRRKSDL